MSQLHRPFAVALLAASLLVVPPGQAAGQPTDSPTTTSPQTTSPTARSSATTSTPATETETTEAEKTPTAQVPATTSSTTPTTTGAPTARLAQQQTAVAAADLADPAGAAADWLVSQLVEGDHFATTFDGQTYPDQGLTADGALALAASGGHDEALGRMVAYLFTTRGQYTGQDFGEVYAGSLAKLALVAVVTGQDPRDVDGQDLIADLLDQMRDDGPDAGRFSDAAFDYDGDGAPDDYSNSISQSLGLLAVDRAGEEVPAEAVDFLVGEQCPDGGFPSLFPIGDEPCVSDPDATGFVVQALDGVDPTPAALSAAVTWLSDNQQADGSFTAEGPVNATAVAGQGLLAVGEDAAAADATSWLAGVQDDDGWLPIAPGGSGDAGDARATTQAVLLLAGETLGSVSRPVTLPVTAPTTPPTTPPAETASPTTTPAVPAQTATQAAAPGSTGSQALAAGRTSGNEPGSLARTGGSADLLVAAAIASMLAGALLVGLARRRPTGAHRG